MSLDFPAAPTNGQQYTAAGITYTWDGTKWVTGGFSPTYVKTTGDGMTGALTGTTAAYSGKVTSAATVSGDSGTTLTTKGYVDSIVDLGDPDALGQISGTGAVNSQQNIASCTRTGTGLYTVTFTTAMSNALYSCLVTPVYPSEVVIGFLEAQTTTSFQIRCTNNSGTARDPSAVNIAVFEV
jgi:hypothetical protein